ncbi:MAG: hypothetical protein G01um101470_635 [Parcubacteria group bacterium Gr01-1014_70]|nr:MAG: hypothetical protein G01um101470_635 [Parcubacteria group bacterium Gr01-1014_70]
MEAQAIKRAVMNIPIGAQTVLPNFNKIPLRGTKFAKKGDIWPMVENEKSSTPGKEFASKKKKQKDDMWL